MITHLLEFRLLNRPLSSVVAFLSVLATTWTASVRYDQSQLGDYNVQIHLKNIELYAILDDGAINSDYDYDYTDLTEKPSNVNGSYTQQQHPQQQQQQQIWTGSNGTTSKPYFPSSSNANYNNYNNINSNNNNIPNNSNYVGSNSDVAFQEYPTSQRTQHPSLATTHQQQVPLQHTSNGLTASPTADSNIRLTRKCAPGFYRDNLGRCRRIRKPHLPFMQMVHTPGVIKSFQQSLEVNASTTGKPITNKQR